MTNIGSLDLRNLIVLIKEAKWLNYTIIPAITIMVFDWLLTLDLEISLVWGSPWSGMKMLFLLARYLPLVDIPVLMFFQFDSALSQHTCKTTFQYAAWAMPIYSGFALLILTTRTWAVCGEGKKLAYALFGSFGLVWAACLTLVELFLRSSTYNASEFPGLTGCTIQAGGSSTYLASIYVLLMLYDGSLLLLMARRGISAFKEGGNSQLARVVYRDGILYYVYIFGLSLVNTAIIFRLQGAFATLLVPIQRVTQSVLACHVVLHIREQGHAQRLLSEQVIGTLRFAQVTRSIDQV